MLVSFWHFKWGGFTRTTRLCPCPCSDCLPLGSKSSHSPLAESWERIVAPCQCSFIEGSNRKLEKTYLGSDGGRYRVPCSLGTGNRCRLRVLYINHVTGEATLHCPCATCSPDWRGVPCLTLGSLFHEDEPCLVEETDDPLIPAQDVGLHIFDDMPGFALAKNHRPSATHEGPLVANTPKYQPLTAEQSDLGTPDSCTITVSLQQSPNKAFSIQTLLSLLVSYIVTRSTPFTDTPRPVSLHEVMEVSLGLSLSMLLVIIYELISIYTYIKDLPRPPPFLSKLVLLVLVVLGLRALKGNFGLV